VENENDIYIQEVLYEKELTTPEIGARLENIKQVIYCDAAEPDRIEELKRLKLYVEPAHKGQGSVNAGIDLLRHKKIHITKDSPNVIKEIQGYSYRELKDGTVIEEPIKVNDHAMDAIRYAVTTRGRTSQPGIIMIDL
jgi:phage terminase large subunit